MPREIKSKVRPYIAESSLIHATLVEGRKQGMTIGIFVGGMIATLAFVLLSSL